MTTPPVVSPELQAEEADPAVTRILDAALELFEDVGIRKSTIEDIARRAAIDRVTVYRRVGSKNDVAQAVIAREAQRLFERVSAGIAAEESLEKRVIAAFTGLTLGMRDHALFNRLVRLEPNETLPKVTTQASEMLATGIHWSVAALAGPAASDAERADLTARVEIIARFVHSTLLTKQAVVDLGSEEKLADFARRHIVPIIAGVPIIE
jgi:AcrR family transcriptional regulator